MAPNNFPSRHRHSTNLAPILPALIATYATGERHYHTLEHVLSCLSTLDTFPNPIPFRAEIELALWFHDAIYDPQRTDNEAQSAALLRSLCAYSGLSDYFINRAARLILVTDHKTPTAPDTKTEMAEAEAIITDVDMAILAAPPSQYLNYTQQIRQEYACYDDSTFSQGRTQFIKTQLSHPTIYRTSHFREKHEAQARSNLRNELQSATGIKQTEPPKIPTPFAFAGFRKTLHREIGIHPRFAGSARLTNQRGTPTARKSSCRSSPHANSHQHLSTAIGVNLCHRWFKKQLHSIRS